MSKKLKITIGVIIGLLVIGLGVYLIIDKKNDDETSYVVTNDSLEFKSEYEAFNGKSASNDKTYLSINIKSYNPIKYSNYEEIFKLLENGTGVIYFGFPECPWCRNLIPVLTDSALDNDIDTIYYLNIREDRDTKELSKNGKIKTTKKATENYTKLVEELKDYLPVYNGLKDDTIKRVYLPTVVFVKDGKVLGLEQSLESFSKRVDGNGYLEMTSEEKTELANIFKGYYDKLK